MGMLFVELLEKLKELDELTLIETLEIDSETLVDRFSDVIENKFDSLVLEYEEEEY